MTRTGSKETVGECIICEGTGMTPIYTAHKGQALPLCYVQDSPCTHCHGSGLRPQKAICPMCNGIGGFSQRTVKELDAHRTPGSPPITSTRCPACLGNGFTILRLTPGQQFESNEVLP